MLGYYVIMGVSVLPRPCQKDAFSLTFALWLYYEYFMLHFLFFLHVWLRPLFFAFLNRCCTQFDYSNSRVLFCGGQYFFVFHLLINLHSIDLGNRLQIWYRFNLNRFWIRCFLFDFLLVWHFFFWFFFDKLSFKLIHFVWEYKSNWKKIIILRKFFTHQS